MNTRWFVVIHSNGSWWVDCEGRANGPFGDRDEARQNAVRLALTHADPARQSLVYVPDDEGRPRLFWAETKPPVEP